MAFNVPTGPVKIVSLLEANPTVGIDHGKPDFQFIYLDAPVSHWEVWGEDDSTCRFVIGGYQYMGVLEDDVIVTVNPEQRVRWIVTYREYQKAYTIELARDPSKGWTVADNSAYSKIAIRPIKRETSTPPEEFSPYQLFRFVPVVPE